VSDAPGFADNALRAFAKINLSLVVGPLRADGKHEVATVLQRVDLCDDVELEAREDATVVVEGFEDTIVRRALGAFAKASRVAHGWRVRIDKRIPVAAGLGGGSSDAAAALELANRLTAEPLARERLQAVAAEIGADVPFFLTKGTALATGDGSELSSVGLPTDMWVVIVLPAGTRKESTGAVYRHFDELGRSDGFEERRRALFAALDDVARPVDLAALPSNDLTSSPFVTELEKLGAFRADVSGAGPAIYGLFEQRADAERAARELREAGAAWLTRPTAG
jgi:4-diphosphocytidyl-2-C-methyl-D-erythritol kinase